MKRYWKTIRYIDLCLLWQFEVPVIGKRILTVDTLLYLRVKKNGEEMKGNKEGYATIINDNPKFDDSVIGHFESKNIY